MATALRPIGHDDRLSVVDHLDELRTRLIVSGVTLVVALGVCFWQNHALLHLLNRPLENSTPSAQHAGKGRLASTASAAAEQRAGFAQAQRAASQLSRSTHLAPADRLAAGQLAAGLGRAVAALPKTVPKREPVTIGVGEPFTITFTVAAYFALLFSLPVLLYQAYAFVLPAFRPEERRVAIPIMLLAPFLFAAGAVFAYFMVLPPAISFLQNFNNTSFDVLIQAKSYYTFEIYTLLAIGLVFQLPLGLLGLDRVGIINARFLIRNWRYAIVLIAVLAALLPGVDPVTTMLEMIPLLLLYGLSILLLLVADRRAPRQLRESPFAFATDDEDHEPDDLT
ncbi:MAG: Sec-independent protein translocase, TatC subunit [Solirubrobacterales bacterium]|nr:Sec-independent protein translocase, TatC subunit [Solirubrobacterales bacterium]